MPKKKQNFLSSPEYTSKKNVTELISRLKKLYPEAKCSLNYNTNFELLIATILSAQCTDERVNKVTASLFRKYRTISDYANAILKELEQDVHSTGFYRNKAKNIQATAIRILEHYKGQVPETMQELLTLPGVAIKTANVVLGTGFGKAEGIVVDTHVRRISQRLGLTNKEDPKKIELELKDIIPLQDWIEFSHLLIYHGRQTCKAINPQCQNCMLSDLCPSNKLASK